MSRKPIIAANWKMYKAPAEVRDCVEVLLPLCLGHARDEIVICPPAISLSIVLDTLFGSGYLLVPGMNITPYNLHKTPSLPRHAQVSKPKPTPDAIEASEIIQSSEAREKAPAHAKFNGLPASVCSTITSI